MLTIQWLKRAGGLCAHTGRSDQFDAVGQPPPRHAALEVCTDVMERRRAAGFGHDHRDYFSAAMKEQGGEVATLIPIPPTESSFTRYFPQIPADTEVLYHVMVGPAVLTFVKELGPRRWEAVQRIVDEAGEVDWMIQCEQDLSGTFDPDRPLLTLVRIGT